VLPDDPTDTDAWFAAFAPAARARVAVGVLLVGAGVGGDTAAPVAKQVLVAALKATR
jgi:cell division protein FtsI/penicillin-binding protein 2